MRHLAGGVSVITVGRGKDITGMTVTSVVVAVGRSADPDRQHQPVGVVLAAARCAIGVFGVNILTADQLDIAERFTGKDGLKGSERFAGADWTTARPACRCWSARWRRPTARSRRSSSAIRTPSSSAASATSGLVSHRGAGLLAGTICRHRSRRGCRQAGRGQRPAAAAPALRRFRPEQHSAPEGAAMHFRPGPETALPVGSAGKKVFLPRGAMPTATSFFS